MERDVVVSAMRENFPLFSGEVSNELSASDVAGWDSFAHVNLMFTIEANLGRSFDISETFGLQNIGELISFLEKQEN
ncbi:MULTISPECIES: acyl carrier protein [unclassified Ensifer]|nr:MULTISPECIES: acyl carrier protein [unclassified Ensifer]